MKNLLRPFLRPRSQLKDCRSFRKLDAQFAARGLDRLHRPKRDLQAHAAAEEQLFRLEQRLPLGALLCKPHHAIHFLPHNGTPLLHGRLKCNPASLSEPL